MLRLRNLTGRIKNNPRLARILHGGASALLGKGTSMLISMVTLPLTIRYLGRTEYGIWVTISSSVVMVAVLDLGISSTLTNFIAKSHANDDREMARGYFASAFWITSAIAAIMGVLFYVVWRFLDWGKLFGFHDPVLIHQTALAIGIAFAFFLINLPLSLANRVLSGFQQVQIANYFGMINSVIYLISILIGIAAHVSIVGLMLCLCLSMLTGGLLLNGWLTLFSRPWIMPRLSAARRHMARDLFGEGILFFVLQIAGLIVFNSDNLVITHFLGAGEVTPYSISWKLMSYASMLHGLMIPALWPAFSDAYHRSDLAWIKSTYRRVMRATMLGVCSVAIVLALIGQWVIRVWATKAAVPPQSLLWAMALWAVILSVTTNQATLLAATQRIGLQALTSSLAAIVNLLATIYLVQRMGSLGVILGTLISYVIFIVAPQSWEVRNILRGKYLQAVVHAE